LEKWGRFWLEEQRTQEKPEGVLIFYPPKKKEGGRGHEKGEEKSFFAASAECKKPRRGPRAAS